MNITIDLLSMISRKLKIKCDSADLGDATGFVYKLDEKYFLISNWHVFSNKNPQTGHYIKGSAEPDELIFDIPRQDAQGSFSFTPKKLSLLDDDRNPLWIEMPVFGKKYDIAAIEFQIEDPHISVCSLNSTSSPYNHIPQVTSEVYIIGFPLGLAVDDKYPIWKRGSIATEMAIDYAALPMFVVDSATREGMSGSPVFWRSIGLVDPSRGNIVIDGQTYTSFLGVYSGRYGNSKIECDAQLGRVWRAQLVLELVTKGLPAKTI
jgi:Trypsin-like peptidase domain